jgi:hypothetical protein
MQGYTPLYEKLNKRLILCRSANRTKNRSPQNQVQTKLAGAGVIEFLWQFESELRGELKMEQVKEGLHQAAKGHVKHRKCLTLQNEKCSKCK